MKAYSENLIAYRHQDIPWNHNGFATVRGGDGGCHAITITISIETLWTKASSSLLLLYAIMLPMSNDVLSNRLISIVV